MTTHVIHGVRLIGNGAQAKRSSENSTTPVTDNFVSRFLRRISDFSRECSHARRGFYSYRY